MAIFRIEVSGRVLQADEDAASLLREAGLRELKAVYSSRLFLMEGRFTRTEAERIANGLLVDAVTEMAQVRGVDDPPFTPPQGIAFEIHPRPGVMDPVAESTLAELRAEGFEVESVRTARRHIVTGSMKQDDLLAIVPRVLANDCIEQVVAGTAGVKPAPKPPVLAFHLRPVPMRALDDHALERLSRDGHLFLSLDEMRAVRAYFQELGRDPTDLELETLAQTWSEHCVHKTLKSAVLYRGAPMPPPEGEPKTRPAVSAESIVEIRYANLLKDTIARATDELIAEGRGPQCLSVFKDNAGVIAFDDQYGVAFKVETHNHPSAIEPYGGAATGVGGCIRDVIGCGLGARPIANTDVFCVAPSDWPRDRLPKGVLHPQRVLRGVVRGVADYGNRMGIPTVNGAVYFDPRYLGNPLVYCGCVGLIPRDKLEKAARPGDLVVLVGGRTGRDGIHGATFSSAELTDSHADEFSHAVQIGNAITEKRVLDAVLRARDDEAGCLYTAITDCGAGGLSSAVGEMGEQVGAEIDLETVPLKYAGLRYDEIWISEAQERMVLAVPPERLDRFLRMMREEEAEATVIGKFGAGAARPRLIVRYQGNVVGDLAMDFLHHGLPKRERFAEWQPAAVRIGMHSAEKRLGSETIVPDVGFEQLLRHLSRPTVAGKEWIIRKYDHEVQGGSVVKPLGGPGGGPNDAAVLRPRLDSRRGIAVGCGLAPHWSDYDPYWMAAAALDEAIRNVVCVGGDPERTAVLDNFCWGRADDPRQLGALVRACQACYDAAKAYGAPFISGKDSLNNEFALDDRDVAVLLETIRQWAQREDLGDGRAALVLQMAEQRLRETKRISIPGTLLISAISLVEDIGRCVTADLKAAGNRLYLVGGLPCLGFSLTAAANIHRALAEAIRRKFIVACHDAGDGGWLTALAEMAVAGDRGVEIRAAGGRANGLDPFTECCAAYLVETPDAAALETFLAARKTEFAALGTVRADRQFQVEEQKVEVGLLRAAWKK